VRTSTPERIRASPEPQPLAQCILWDPSDRPQRTAAKFGGQSGYITGNIKDQDRLLWFHNRCSNKSQIDIEELTHLEMEARNRMLITHDYRKRYTPGFENSLIVLTCPQLGCRGRRRMRGDYLQTLKDMAPNAPFPDTIAIFPNVDRNETSDKFPIVFIL
jgi:hypothetical protein